MAKDLKERWKIVRSIREFAASRKKLYAHAAAWENRVIGWMLDQWAMQLGPAGDPQYTKMVRRFRECVQLPTRNAKWVWYHADIDILLAKI